MIGFNPIGFNPNRFNPNRFNTGLIMGLMSIGGLISTGLIVGPVLRATVTFFNVDRPKSSASMKTLVKTHNNHLPPLPITRFCSL